MTSKKQEPRSQISRRGSVRPLDIVVDAAHVAAARAADCDAGRCAVSQGLIANFGGRAIRPLSDTDFMRFTDLATGMRMFYQTPPKAQALIQAFDLGNEELVASMLPLRVRVASGHAEDRRSHNGVTLAAIRSWAAEQPGLTVSSRGPVPAAVVAAYRAAHPGAKVRKEIEFSAARGSVKPNVVSRQPPVRRRAPLSRRRTWGRRELTQILVDQGWTPPPAR